MVHFLYNGCAVLLIERIARVNEEKPPVLILGLLLPQKPYRVNPPLNPGLQTPTELLLPAGLLDLRPCHRQHTLQKHLETGISHSDCPYTRVLVKADEAPWHQRPVVHPGWAFVDHTFTKIPNNLP